MTLGWNSLPIVGYNGHPLLTWSDQWVKMNAYALESASLKVCPWRKRGFEPGTSRLLSERLNRYSTEVCDEGASLILIGNQISAYISEKYCVLLLAIAWNLETTGGYWKWLKPNQLYVFLATCVLCFSLICKCILYMVINELESCYSKKPWWNETTILQDNGGHRNHF